MSPRSPHVNMRVPRDTHDQLTRMALEWSVAAGRRLSLTDVLAVTVVVGGQHAPECIKALKTTDR